MHTGGCKRDLLWKLATFLGHALSHILSIKYTKDVFRASFARSVRFPFPGLKMEIATKRTVVTDPTKVCKCGGVGPIPTRATIRCWSMRAPCDLCRRAPLVETRAQCCCFIASGPPFFWTTLEYPSSMKDSRILEESRNGRRRLGLEPLAHKLALSQRGATPQHRNRHTLRESRRRGVRDPRARRRAARLHRVELQKKTKKHSRLPQNPSLAPHVSNFSTPTPTPPLTTEFALELAS